MAKYFRLDIDGMEILFMNEGELKVIWTYKGYPVFEQIARYNPKPGYGLKLEYKNKAKFKATIWLTDNGVFSDEKTR